MNLRLYQWKGNPTIISEIRILFFYSNPRIFFIKGEIKLSYEFPLIEEALKDGRLGKAVVQIAKNIERILLKQLKLDEDYEPSDIEILPVIIVHDSLYSAPALNYIVHYWMKEQIEILKGKAELSKAIFTNILPITIVEIDTLILFEEDFHQNRLDLTEMLKKYQQHVNFEATSFNSEKDYHEHFYISALPFSEFARDYAHEKNIQFKMDRLSKLLASFGIDNNL